MMNSTPIWKFQFHTGSIKSDRRGFYSDMMIQGFNSILVRLKDQKQSFDGLLDGEFQFHTGSIKSSTENYDAVKSTDVSIPYWFD